MRTGPVRGGGDGARRTDEDGRERMMMMMAEPAADEKKDELVKPTRPKRADFDFDDDKYEAAMAEYDVAVDTYNEKRSAKQVSDALAAKAVEERTSREQTENAKRYDAFVQRKEADAKSIDDWDDVFEAISDKPVEFTPAVELAIMKSDHPGLIMFHFAKDALEHDSEDWQRIAAMDPVDQVREITRLEMNLVNKPTPAPAPAAVVPIAKPEPPAKPKPAPKRVEDPITPVGTRGASTPTRSLAEVAEMAAAGDTAAVKEYLRRRAAHEN